MKFAFRAVSYTMILFSILTLCLLAPSAVDAAEVEAAAVQTNVIEPEDFGHGPLGATFYNPTGVKVGNELFLYVQGGPTGSEAQPCAGDKIYLFRAPWTQTGLRSQFQWESQTQVSFERDDGTVENEGVTGRVSPCKSTDHHYGLGGVFVNGGSGQYVMMLDQASFPTANVFREILIGFSNDGVSWSWEPFVESTGNYSILDVTLKSSDVSSIYCNPSCHSHTTWWGFFRFGPGDNGSGRVGKMKVDYSSQYPRGFRVWIQSGGVWAQVNDTTGEYSFQPDDVRPNGASFAPNALVDNNGQLELWAFQSGVSGCGCDFGNGSTFLNRSVDFGSLGTISGSRVSVFSKTRCMPSDNGVGRLFPFVITGPSGKRLLYSSSNDKNCTNLQSGGHAFVGMYTLVTELE